MQYYNLKHPRPVEQSPSKDFAEQLDKVKIDVKNPIVDVACGYGRNGAYCVDKGYNVIFLDNDPEALNFIKEGNGVSVLSSSILGKTYSVIQMDLNRDEWPYQKNSLSGIILVHYYNRKLLPLLCDSIESGGFLYFETIDMRGHNYLGLPFENEVESYLVNKFEIRYRKSRTKLIPFYSSKPVETVKIFALKK